MESLKEVRMRLPISFATAVVKLCYAINPANLTSATRACYYLIDFFIHESI